MTAETSDVVIGIGDRPRDETLTAAFTEPALRNADLQAIHAWQPRTDTVLGSATPSISSAEEIQRSEE